MTGSEIAIALLRYGPIVLTWLDDLSKVWDKEMTPEEVKDFVLSRRKSYDDYIAAEKAKRLS